MKWQDVHIDEIDQNDCSAFIDAANSIENDNRNYDGNNNGRHDQTLSKGAVKRLAAIWAHIDSRWPE